MKIKNISKGLLISGLLALSASAQAQWQWNTLLGVSAGYADRSGDLQLYVFDGTDIDEATLKLSDSGFIWGVLGGLQAHCNNWLFGGELHVDWHNFDNTKSYGFDGDIASARFERGTMLALSARAGYQMAPYFMPYIRLGIETSKDELTVNVVEPNGTSIFGAAEDKRTYRFLGGLGVEVPVSYFQGLSLRAEYNYHGKGKAVNVSGYNSAGTDIINIEYKPKTHSGKISVVYNFI